MAVCVSTNGVRVRCINRQMKRGPWQDSRNTCRGMRNLQGCCASGSLPQLQRGYYLLRSLGGSSRKMTSASVWLLADMSATCAHSQFETRSLTSQDFSATLSRKHKPWRWTLRGNILTPVWALLRSLIADGFAEHTYPRCPSSSNTISCSYFAEQTFQRVAAAV